MDFHSGWTHDFCLYCDTLAVNGAYCSEACRVADFRQALPVHSEFHTQQPQWQSIPPFLNSSQPPFANPAVFDVPSADASSQYTSSRNSSLSSTPTFTTSSAPASLVDLRTANDLSFHSIAHAARTTPTTPLLQDHELHRMEYGLQAFSPFDKLKPLNSTTQRPLDAVDSSDHQPFVTSDALASQPHLAIRLGVSNRLSHAARQELKRYDDSFDLSRRRRQRTLP